MFHIEINKINGSVINMGNARKFTMPIDIKYDNKNMYGIKGIMYATL